MSEETRKDGVEAKFGWYACPAEIELTPEIGIYERAVWHNFAAHANRATGACFPSRDLQAKEIGISVNKVTEARRRLIEKGMLKKTTVKRKNGMIDRYQWEILANWQTCCVTNRPYDQQTVSATANHKNLNHKNLNQSYDTAPPEVGAEGQVGERPKAQAKLKASDDAEPMSRDEFVDWCRKSVNRHVRVIGEWVDEMRPEGKTKGQWRTYLKRNLRAAVDLAKFDDGQLSRAMGEIYDLMRLKKFNPTMETLLRRLTK